METEGLLLMGVLALSEGGSFEKKGHELYVPERSSKTRRGVGGPSENNRELQEFSLRVWRVRASAAVAEARVQFPAPIWWFTTIQNPDSRRSGTLF